MDYYHIEFDKDKSVQVEDNYVVDNYIGKELNIGHSLVRTHLDGKHPLMKILNQIELITL